MQETKREGATDLRGRERVAESKRKGRAHASAKFAVNFCVRTIFWLSLLACVLFFSAIAVARFWVVPNADDFRPRIVEALSTLTKQRVVVSGLSATWNGWSPEFKVTRLQILDNRGRTLLELPEVETTLSWRSLIVFEPRLSTLTVKNPRVVVRRTAENQLTLAGIDVDLTDTTPSDPAALEWLLRQRYVQIEGGEFEWQDEWRKLPPLRMRDVNIRLANDGAHHRVGLNATPSAEIASPIQFRAEFVGSDLRKIDDWDGSAYVRVDYANAALLARYLPLPIEIARGDGGIQAWFDFENGRPMSVTSDLVIRDANVKVPTTLFADESAKPATAATGTAQTESIAVRSFSGRLSWRETASPTGQTFAGLVKRDTEEAPRQQRWSLRDIVLTPAKGEALPAISAELKLDRVGDAIRGGEFRTAKIDLPASTQLAELFSTAIPASWLAALKESAPRGQLGDVVALWRYGERDALAFEVSGKLDAVGWQRGTLPGVSALSGKVKLSEREGEFVFASPSTSLATLKTALPKKERTKDAKVDAAKPTLAPLEIDLGERLTTVLKLGAVGGSLDWKRLSEAVAASGNTPAKRAVWQVRTEGISIDGDDAKGKFAGSWQSDDLGPGIAKFSGKFERVAVTSVHKYLPTTASEAARTWVRAGIVEGKAKDVNVALEGPLWHFPFEDSKQGKFEIVAPVTDMIVDYADGWPRAENVDALLTFRGASMTAAVNRATIAGASLGPTQVQIADMGSTSATLDLRGSATATIDQFLRFIEASPVNRMLDRFTEGAKGTGSGRLNLGLSIPLAHAEKTKVDGEFAFENNRIELGSDIPPLDNVTGRLRFSEQEVRAKDIAVNALGGATMVNVVTEGGVIKTSASGRAELARVRERYDYPLLDQLKGQATWAMEMLASRSASEGSTLRVTGSIPPQTLPIDAVFQAAATPRDTAQPIAFSMVRTSLAQGRDRIEFELPSILHAILERSSERVREGRTVERAVVDLGAQKTQLPVRGYSIRGDLAKLNADAALALLPALTGTSAKNVGGVKTETSSPDFVNVSLRADRAIVFSHVLNDASLRAQPSGQRWRLALRSKEASGVISVDNAADGSGDIEAVSVRLQRFAWPAPATESDKIAGAAKAASNAPASGASTQWPKLDLVAESFVSEGRELGRLEVKAQPSREEWRIESVKLVNNDGTISGKGRWRLAAQPQTAQTAQSAAGPGQTSMEVALNWKDAGRFMQRFGLPKGVDRGEGELNGELNWPGSPASFAYDALGGKFTLKTGGGRFSEMEPGIAKLLGIISLQSIPRRLSFNFDDLFGRGFAFDSIAADVSIASGKASTESFEIAGPAARVDIRGSADLNAETAQLRVRVFPSVSVATAIGVGLATANPAIGAAAWLGQKIARDPVERLLMQEFDVSGAWSNPEVKQTRGMGAETNDTNRSTAGTN